MRQGAQRRHRVVHAVATRNFAGVERYLTYIGPELARRDYDVRIVGGDPERMRAALNGTGVVHHPAANLPAVMQVLLRCRRVDLVHAHMTAAEVAAAAVKRVIGAPLVVTRHFGASRGSSAAARAVGRLAARAINRQIAISEYVASQVEGPSTVLRSGVPDSAAGSHDEPIVLVLQRMEPEKEGATAIEAWSLSGLAATGWRLVLAGEGAERVRLEQLALCLGVSGSVDFLGFVDDPHELMARASIFLAPASKEPLGLSVIEAMARSLPVAASAGGGHLETAGRAVPACLFAPGDSMAAARLLRKLAGDPELRHALGVDLRRYQQDQLSIARHVDRLDELYQQLAAR